MLPVLEAAAPEAPVLEPPALDTPVLDEAVLEAAVLEEAVLEVGAVAGCGGIGSVLCTPTSVLCTAGLMMSRTGLG